MKRERRGYARLYVGSEARYKQKDKQEGQVTVLLQDISVSGVRFISNEALDNNTVLEFTLTIPNIATPLTAVGRVVWQKKVSKSFFDTGIEFTQMESEHKEKLSQYIRSALGRVEERREFMRCNLSTMVAYRLISEPAVEYNCLSVDISPTGMRVFMKEKLENGTGLQLSFYLPDDSAPVSVQGDVVWLREIEDNFWEAGIRFTNIEEKDKERLQRYVKENLGLDW